MKIKLFSHTDFDGIGCAILARLAFENVDIEYCNYDDINQKVKDFIQNQQYKDYDYVYITDISVNEEVAELIHTTHPDNFKDGFNLCEMFQLLDHHKTAEWLNKYWWVIVQEIDDNNENEKCSGTSMFYKFLILDEELPNKRSIYNFVETVRRYDTWEWQTKYNDDNPKKWNDLLYIYGRQRFIDKIIFQLNASNFSFENTDLILLELNQEKINYYIESKEKKMIVKEINGYQTGIVFADQYQSELGNVLAKNHAELDFIIIIDLSSTISYRGIKDAIDLGQFAKIYGGGGHPKAAGSQISENIKNKVIEVIFN